MRVVKRTQREKEKGAQLGQFLAGVVGSMVTTLPSFLVMPFWFAFSHEYRITNNLGEDNDFACGLICFGLGVLTWATVLLLVN